MKNQYVCDIGDYGKYGLLRFLAQHGFRIGVNWYLTDNDGSSDGNKTAYLEKDSERNYDPVVYDSLRAIAERSGQMDRTVQMIQEAGLIPNAIFFDKPLNTDQTSPMKRAWNRRSWFEYSKRSFRAVDLVFADPDNGITYKKSLRNKGSEKYILPEEVAQYYYGGKDVVFYCHRGRRVTEEWERAKVQIKEHVCDADLFVLTFHRGVQRSYIFVVHPEHAERYESMLTEFIADTSWGKDGAFTREDVIEYHTTSTPDICRRWAILNYFQKAYPSKAEKEKILRKMTNAQIDELIDACSNVQGKIFYSSFKKRHSGFEAPTIGTVLPKGTTFVKNADGRISVVLPASKDEIETTKNERR